MDRSPCRTGLIGAWATCGLLFLPACSENASSPSVPASRTPVVAGTSTDDRPCTAQERVSRADRRQVVPAGHLFAPPPLPHADQSRLSVERTLSRPLDRPPVVQLAPVPGDRIDDSPNPDVPRRLPDACPSEPAPGEPQLLRPLADDVPEEAGLAGDALGQLPPLVTDTPRHFRRLPPLDVGESPPIEERHEDHLTGDHSSDDGERVHGPWQVVEPPADAPRMAQPDAEPLPRADDHPPRTENAVENSPAAEGAGDRPVHLLPPPAWDPVTVPVPNREDAADATARDRGAALAVLARQVDVMSRRGEDLASRGAYFAARAEMIKALRLITQVLDAQGGGGTHSRALGEAMRAFREAADFLPRGSQLEAELNVSQVVSGHRTPVLKHEHLEHLAPVTAQQRYVDYAQRQLVVAGGGLPAASQALHGLAKICTVLDLAKLETQTLFLPQAVALHQAALLVDPGNYHAANELGVLLARFGQWEDARRVLLHGIAVHGAPEMWRNLSVVHERLGEPDLARRARREADLAASAPQTRTDQDWAETIRWVDASTFSAAGAAAGH